MSLWLTAKRVARYGLIGFIRNGFISLSAVLIMTITLFIVAWLVIMSAAVHSALADLEKKVDITVYFTTTATQDQIQQVESSVKALPEVADVRFVTREQALESFQERHKNDQLTMQALSELGENPLGSSLEIRAKDPSQYESIAKYLETEQSIGSTGSVVDKINFFQNKTAIDRLTVFTDIFRKIILGAVVFFGFASILIVFNTVRLAIYTARDEIGVMNIVGASHWYVRGPFMIAGVLYGLISGLVVLIVLYPVAVWLGPGSEQFLGSFNVFTYYTNSFGLLFAIVMGSGIALGAISSYLAVRRYLRA